MIKNNLNKHIKFEQLKFDKGYPVFEEDTSKKRYEVCGAYPPEKLESVLIVCDYYKHLHFCLIQCIQGVNFPDEYFNLLIQENEFTSELHNDILYLVDNIYEKLKNI